MQWRKIQIKEDNSFFFLPRMYILAIAWLLSLSHSVAGFSQRFNFAAWDTGRVGLCVSQRFRMGMFEYLNLCTHLHERTHILKYQFSIRMYTRHCAANRGNSSHFRRSALRQIQQRKASRGRRQLPARGNLLQAHMCCELKEIERK